LRVIVVVEQVRAVNLYVAAVEALRKKERGDETQFPTKIGLRNYFGFQFFRFVKAHFQLSI
jgi:hypothetical protein